jgi:RHH-type rel operon transcriptional repressor/antitoxin RelB
MEPLLEKELEQAARRQGITKSQFIIDAVQRALGRKNPYDLLLQAQELPALNMVSEAIPINPFVGRAADDVDNDDVSMSERMRRKLRIKHSAATRDWLAYQEAKRLGVAWAPDDERGPAT